MNPRGAILSALEAHCIDFKICKPVSVCHFEIVEYIVGLELQWAPELPSLVIVDYWFVDLLLSGVTELRDRFLDKSNHLCGDN